MPMTAFVITRLCRDCVDQSCVEVCPVACIVQHQPATDLFLPNQLFINPEDCIGCSVCEPECPWEAIYEQDAVPVAFTDDIALNAISAERASEFTAPDSKQATPPTPAQVEANKRRWGVE